MPALICIILLAAITPSFAADGAALTDSAFVIRRERLGQIHRRMEEMQPEAVRRIMQQPDRVKQQLARLDQSSKSSHSFVLASLQRNRGSILFDVAAAGAWGTALHLAMMESDLEQEIRSGSLRFTTYQILHRVVRRCLDSNEQIFRFPADRSGIVEFLDSRAEAVSATCMGGGINLAISLSILHAMLESDANVVELLSH